MLLIEHVQILNIQELSLLYKTFKEKTISGADSKIVSIPFPIKQRNKDGWWVKQLAYDVSSFFLFKNKEVCA